MTSAAVVDAFTDKPFAGNPAGLVMLIPVPPAAAPAPTGSQRLSAVALLLGRRPLRRVTVTTVAVAGVGGGLGVLAVRLADELTGHPERGAWFIAAVGAGNLASALLLIAKPQHAEPVRTSLKWAAALGLGYLAVAAVPSLVIGLAVFAAIGALTAPWVTATLAARDTYAPSDQRAQTFVAMAGWKIAAASAGTALGGLAAGLGARLPMIFGAALVAAAVAAALLDRDPSPGTPARSPALPDVAPPVHDHPRRVPVPAAISSRRSARRR